MNCACRKMIEVVVRHSCTEIRLHLSQCTESVFRAGIVAGITRIILTKDMTSGMRDQIFLFFLRKSTTLCNVSPTPSLA